MNLTAKSAVANILTVATGLIGAATIFHENAYAMLYTGMFGVTSGAVISALSSFTEDSHAKILRLLPLGFHRSFLLGVGSQ